MKSRNNKSPRPNQLSPQQIENLLEAMQNEEKKVQEKMEAKKIKGAKRKTEKDWVKKVFITYCFIVVSAGLLTPGTMLAQEKRGCYFRGQTQQI